MKHFDHGYDIELIGVLKELAEKTGNQRPIHFQPAGDYLLDGVRYHSRPEAACGYLLNHYISDFSLKPGKSFQVPIGVGKGGDLQTVDFRYGENFIEYHPPRIHQHGARRKKGSKREPRELRMLRGILRKPKLPKRVRDRTYARLKGYLTRRYVESRMRVLSASPVVEDFTLVVLGSPEELYKDFLRVHATKKLPPLRFFLKDFKRLLKQVVDLRREVA